MSVRNGEGLPEGYLLGCVAGKANERERIIALLKAELNDNCGMCNYDCGQLIALIGGETE